MKLIIAVLLSLTDVENLIHIWFLLFFVELNEDSHRNCKQTGVKGEERESRHLGKKELALKTLKHDGIVNSFRVEGEGRVRLARLLFTPAVTGHQLRSLSMIPISPKKT